MQNKEMLEKARYLSVTPDEIHLKALLEYINDPKQKQYIDELLCDKYCHARSLTSGHLELALSLIDKLKIKEFLTSSPFDKDTCGLGLHIGLTSYVDRAIKSYQASSSYLSEIPLACIYILSNISMVGLLKIGFTRRSVHSRIAELNSATGVPSGFALEKVYKTPSSGVERMEFKIHRALREYRVSNNKEFFRIEIDAADKVIEGLLIDQSEFRE